MWRYVCCLLLVLSSVPLLPALAQQAPPTDCEKLVDEGLNLYSRNQNNEALARFQQALKLQPNEFRAQYGTALVYYTTGRYDEAVALCKALVKRGDDKLPNLYVTYGTSLDRQHQSAEAVRVYQQAVQKFPDDEALWRYQGIAFQNLQRYDEAAVSFQKAVRLLPDKPAAHLLLAQIEAVRNHRLPALLGCMRGLLLESRPGPTAQAMGLLDRLLQSGVQQTGPNAFSLNLPEGLLDKSGAAKKPDDFAMAEAMLTLETALDNDDKNKGKNPGERLGEKLNALCEDLARQQANQPSGFTWQVYVPFFVELAQKGYVPTLAYVIQAKRLAAKPAVSSWLAEHPQQVKELSEWVKTYH